LTRLAGLTRLAAGLSWLAGGTRLTFAGHRFSRLSFAGHWLAGHWLAGLRFASGRAIGGSERI
jgi:hypothetical protein